MLETGPRPLAGPTPWGCPAPQLLHVLIPIFLSERKFVGFTLANSPTFIYKTNSGPTTPKTGKDQKAYSPVPSNPAPNRTARQLLPAARQQSPSRPRRAAGPLLPARSEPSTATAETTQFHGGALVLLNLPDR